MFTMNNRKQPREEVYKKAVLKFFSISTGIHTPVLASFINQVTDLQVCDFIKKRL